MNTPEQVAEFMKLSQWLQRERKAGREAPRVTADRLRAFLGLLPEPASLLEPVDKWRPAQCDQDYVDLVVEKFKNNAR